jgi:hypothetical protein
LAPDWKSFTYVNSSTLEGSVQSSASSSVQKVQILPFSTSRTSGRRKTYTYYSGAGSGNGGRKGGSGSKGHTQCPHCGYTMFHKDTSVCKSVGVQLGVQSEC